MPMLAAAQGKISSGDTLAITIKGVPQEEQIQINGAYPVTNGRIKIPYISGYISASGQSAEAVSRRIEAAYKAAKIYNNPTISIAVQSFRKTEAERHKVQKFVTLSGEVSRPGPLPFRPGMTISEAVFSGAPSTFGATNRVILIRNGKTYKYNMKDTTHMSVKLYANDHIKVPQKNMWGK